MQSGEMVDVRLDELQPNPWQPRAEITDEAVAELADSIDVVGLLQEPMARPAAGGYQLAFGHTRIEALRQLQEQGKWGETVRAKVAELTDKEMALIALSENTARRDLRPVEELAAWNRALQIEELTITALAEQVGLDRTTMSKNLAVLELPAQALALVDGGRMSLRAARELLCLRTPTHMHEDQIASVLEDLGESRWVSGPEDYRVTSVRQSIKGLSNGSAHKGGNEWFQSHQKAWRPLHPTYIRIPAFSVEDFKWEFGDRVHVLPEGEESGGEEWTCAAKEWTKWQSAATREQKKDPTSAKGKEPADPWWNAVLADPIVKARLNGSKPASFSMMSAEDREALGSRVLKPSKAAITLPAQLQPKGATVQGNRPPMMDFSECGTCTTGARWHGGGQWDKPSLVCENKKAYMDRQSVGAERFVLQLQRRQKVEAELDNRAALRLSSGLRREDAIALWHTHRGWLKNVFKHVAAPLERSEYSLGYDARTRYNYWPGSAVMLAAIMGGVPLPTPTSHDWKEQRQWDAAMEPFFVDEVEGFDYQLAVACVLVWQARLTAVGEDLWTVATATEEDRR